MPTTTAPTYCPACGGDEPPGLPIHSDELGPYVICPTCKGSHDICTESNDLDAPHILPEDYPLPPTRQLTDTERTVLRGMLP